MLSIDLPNETATQKLAARLAQALPAPAVVYLQGDLGAGKTTLVRAWLRALGHEGPVRSPTYTLIEPYELAGTQGWHLDLYRLSQAEELEYLGLRDMLAEPALWWIEWPERGEDTLPGADLCIELSGVGQGRRARLTPHSAGAQLAVETLSQTET